jgi:hypothetical protein
MGLLKKPASKPMSAALAKATEDADTFVRTKREKNDAERQYKAAKASLKAWLAPLLTRTLPDGRTVTLSVSPRDGYTVESTTAETLTVGPPPAPPV